ncbi:MAG TPA: diphosphate--fructose-6-phosphate 1-phosphotransferase [Myxococcota bacterium]|nr:diphosphate--fructose-6-phosphate 1-phosphotransferase [Myxococcota bacterium]
MADSDAVLALLVGGGPAPGINGVISATTIEARNRGARVIGVLDGFEWLSRGDTKHATPLEIRDVSRIHFRGGSILRTSRTNPTKDPAKLEAVVRALRELHVRWLVTIGGDDTAFSASRVAAQAGSGLSVVHVPKTIDNDLPLPGGIVTFGYETARHVGVSLVETIMEDARATSRWYLLVAMGRKAGHLALGIGKAAGATLTLIPEEFAGEKLRLSKLADVIEGSIIKRRATGDENGTVVIAEGIAELLDPAALEGIEEAERDDHGHVRLSELPLGDVLRRELKRRFAKRGIAVKLVAKDIGYELRCAHPIPFDAEYTRDLGYGAARAALEGESGCMITRQNGAIVAMPFDELMDPKTGRTRVRLVDTSSESYHVARKYMIRLGAADVADPLWLQTLAEAGGTTAADLRARFGA